MLKALGQKLRKQRRRLGFTLDELASRTGISKPYLSVIETARVKNAPSDAKLLRLEETLGFAPGELLSQAHLQQTPKDVRAMLHKLLTAAKGNGDPALLNEACLAGFLSEYTDPAGWNVDQVSARSVPLLKRSTAKSNGAAHPAEGEITGSPDVKDPLAFAVRIIGDCMMPKYHDGEVVICSPALSPRTGDDCFIRFRDGQTSFAQVFFETVAGQKSLRLQPRNGRYQPRLTPADQVEAVYRASYRYQRLDEELTLANVEK